MVNIQFYNYIVLKMKKNAKKVRNYRKWLQNALKIWAIYKTGNFAIYFLKMGVKCYVFLPA